jgi:hypothetical protein
MIGTRRPGGWIVLCILLVLGGCTVRPPQVAPGVAPEVVQAEIGEACPAGDARLHLARLGADTRCGVRLAAGGEAIVAFDPRGDLVLSGSLPLRPGEVVIGVSDGSGVVAYPELRQEGAEVVLPRSGRGERALLHLRRAAGPVDLLVRSVPPPEPEWRFASRFFLPGPRVVLDWSAREAGGQYEVMEADRPVSRTVIGPTRLAVRTRPLYDLDADWQQSYRIEAALDGAPFGVLEFDSSPDLGNWIGRPGTRLGLGGSRTRYLDIPQGQHVLTVTASRDIVVQIAGGAPSRGSRAHGIWALDGTDGLSGRVCMGPDAETIARRLARDNEWLGGGLIASASLASAAASRPEDPDLPAAALRLSGTATFFRDLVPATPKGLPQEVAYVLAPELAENGAASERAPEGFSTGLLLGRLLRGIFLPVPGPEAPLTIELPDRGASSALRLIADHGSIHAPVDLSVSYDGAPPQRLRLLPGRELASGAYAPGPAAHGLLRLSEASGIPAAHLTGSEAFAAHRPAAPLLAGGLAELPLPAGVRRVRVWAEQEGRPLPPRVAVQYRASAVDRLSERAYRGEVARLGRDAARAAFADALTEAIACDAWLQAPDRCPRVAALRRSASIPLRELYNDWIPALRLIRARERGIFGTLPPDLRIAPSDRPAAAPERVDELIRAADAAAGREDWPTAIELWSKLDRESAGASWGRAQLGRAEALLALGEDFLAERLLKGLFLAAPTPDLRRQAYTRLRTLYHEAEAPELLVGLHAGELARAFSTDGLRNLAAALMAEGRDDLAARLAALLPPGEPGSLAPALYRAGWIHELLERTALANPASRQDWLHLLEMRETGARPAAWQAAAGRSPLHSDARLWRDAEEAITTSGGAVDFRAVAHGAHGRLYGAEPDAPLRLSLSGPARLRVSARPLHEAGSDGPLDGWFEIVAGDFRLPVPVTSNHPASGVELIGSGGHAGIAVVETVFLPEGLHDVTIRPEAMTLLIGVEIEEPAIRLPGGNMRLARHPGHEAPPAHHLARLLRRYEAGGEERAALLAEAARLAEEDHRDPAISALWRRFARQSGWERVASVDRSAGMRTVGLPRPVPESPDLRARLALLAPLSPGERLIQSAGATLLSVVNVEPTTITARFRLEALPTLPSRPIRLRYRIGDGEPSELLLTGEVPEREVILSLPQGQEVVRFDLVERHANQFVRLALREADGTLIGEETERTFEVATAEEPVVLSLQGPAWLRIDSLREAETVVETRYINAGFQTVEIHPVPGEDERLVRLFRLVPDDESPAPVPRLPASVERAPVLSARSVAWADCPEP